MPTTTAAAPATTLMRAETLEAPARVAAMLARNRDAFAALGEQLRAAPPPVVVTCARGSSDHAATYGKYLIETLAGVPVASAAPSVASLFEAHLAAPGALLLAISQSGRSPDLLATVDAYAKAGARVAALVNDESSPLAAQADPLLPLSVGPEKSVAATKSCIAALAGLAALTAAWTRDRVLEDALAALPDALDRAARADWSAAVDRFAGVERMFVVARGYGLGIAQECALKFKETCGIQAEPFSAAEVRHGPAAIVGEGFPVLALATSDAAGDDVAAVGQAFAARGALVTLARAGCAADLPAEGAHSAIEPILMLASFYGLVEAVARARGRDPDRPPHLTKVTSTT